MIEKENPLISTPHNYTATRSERMQALGEKPIAHSTFSSFFLDLGRCMR